MSGGRLKLFYSERQALSLPPDHNFPASKYSCLLERLSGDGYSQLFELCPADPAPDEYLLLVHSAHYLQRLVNGQMSEQEMRRIGFPWSPALVQRARRSVGATVAACRAAQLDGMAANLGGGTHHAFPDHGEGYCVFNDVAVAARVLLAENAAQQILVLDCDVHQGNGTAAIFRHEPRVFTFSIHGHKNFPFRKQPGDLDIALPDGCEDSGYLAALAQGIETTLARFLPDLVIYIAGADPYAGDRLGRMALSKPGLADRDRLVFESFNHKDIPLAVVLGGGYARQVDDIVDINLQTLLLAAHFHQMN